MRFSVIPFMQKMIAVLQSKVDYVNRSTFALIYDVTVSSLSVPLALLLRVGLDINKYAPYYIAKHMVVFGVICAGTYWWVRLDRVVWRYVSTRELWVIVRAVSIAVICYGFLWFLLSAHQALPRSIAVIAWFLTIGFLGGARFAYRMICDFQEAHSYPKESVDSKRILLIGISDHTEKFIRATLNNPANPFDIVGIVEEGTSRIGRQIHGVDIRGTVTNLEKVLEYLQESNLSPDIVVVGDLQGGGATLRQIFEYCQPYQLPVKRLPKLVEWAVEQMSPASLNPVALEDLLRRPQISLEQQGVQELIQGSKILVTGAGGSIGSELVRQICSFNPSQILLLDNSEYALYRIHQEVSQEFAKISNNMILADVSDRARIQELFSNLKPDLVFHAAALKHVPIVEENPVEAVITNVVGTKCVAEACRENQVKAMVMISTDKAINPSSIMGATKRLAERYCQSLDVATQATRFVTVRFGNVLGSTGSVVPLFQSQIEKGGPITITDPKMQRYFMTIAEAVELVLQAATLGMNPQQQKGEIYVLDMGAPLYVEDVARHLIRLAGLRPDQDIELKYVGSRAGEKLFEELFYPTEQKQETFCSLIHVAHSTIQRQDISHALDELEKYARKHQKRQTMHLLQAMVPEYSSPILQNVG